MLCKCSRQRFKCANANNDCQWWGIVQVKQNSMHTCIQSENQRICLAGNRTSLDIDRFHQVRFDNKSPRYLRG